jgi:hypothetical protein
VSRAVVKLEIDLGTIGRVLVKVDDTGCRAIENISDANGYLGVDAHCKLTR